MNAAERKMMLKAIAKSVVNLDKVIDRYQGLISTVNELGENAYRDSLRIRRFVRNYGNRSFCSLCRVYYISCEGCEYCPLALTVCSDTSNEKGKVLYFHEDSCCNRTLDRLYHSVNCFMEPCRGGRKKRTESLLRNLKNRLKYLESRRRFVLRILTDLEKDGWEEKYRPLFLA